ncbi:hypothetical protein RISK_003753 [Rhodopirellula islandica]|uniref:Uncharacterized protein n=1 Tax=Rhodopirellula islandica TaxID=595434 RepID=A0A0J1BC22_RHOIS|nr:hypothetical protein RISK_003753 [Rhodopirellula islandica]
MTGKCLVCRRKIDASPFGPRAVAASGKLYSPASIGLLLHASFASRASFASDRNLTVRAREISLPTFTPLPQKTAREPSVWFPLDTGC